MFRHRIFSLVLLVQASLLGGCAETVRSTDLSLQQAELRASMQALLGQALATGEDSIEAYLQLESYLSRPESGDWLPDELVEQSNQISASFRSLQNQLDRTVGASDTVASMLAAEAREQQDVAARFAPPEEQVVAYNVLGNAMQATAFAVETLGDSVRHYDTIVSMLQGANGVAPPQLSADVNAMLESVFRVNSEIRQNVTESMEVIASL